MKPEKGIVLTATAAPLTALYNALHRAHEHKDYSPGNSQTKIHQFFASSIEEHLDKEQITINTSLTALYSIKEFLDYYFTVFTATDDLVLARNLITNAILSLEY